MITEQQPSMCTWPSNRAEDFPRIKKNIKSNQSAPQLSVPARTLITNSWWFLTSLGYLISTFGGVWDESCFPCASSLFQSPNASSHPPAESGIGKRNNHQWCHSYAYVLTKLRCCLQAVWSWYVRPVQKSELNEASCLIIIIINILLMLWNLKMLNAYDRRKPSCLSTQAACSSSRGSMRFCCSFSRYYKRDPSVLIVLL